jgi:hypothetical protein
MEKEKNQELDKINKEQATNEVISAMQRMTVMGANDYEPGAMKDILKNLDEGLIEPEEAVRQALAIEASKQDYH